MVYSFVFFFCILVLDTSPDSPHIKNVQGPAKIFANTVSAHLKWLLHEIFFFFFKVIILHEHEIAAINVKHVETCPANEV